MAEVHSAGKEIDAYCTKCKLDLAATVVAAVNGVAVQVECNTCHTVRKYRSPKSAPKAKRKSTRRATEKKGTSPARAKTVTMSHQELWMQALKGRSVRDAVRYNIRETFADDVVVAHSKFGIGVVMSQAPPDRIKVQFRDAERTLINNYSR